MTRPEHPSPGTDTDQDAPPATSNSTADESGDIDSGDIDSGGSTPDEPGAVDSADSAPDDTGSVDPRHPTEDASSPDLTTGDGSEETPEPLEPPD